MHSIFHHDTHNFWFSTRECTWSAHGQASFTKLKSGSWRAQIRRKGQYVNETFLRRKDAEEWALDMAAGSGAAPTPPPKPMSDNSVRWREAGSRSSQVAPFQISLARICRHSISATVAMLRFAGMAAQVL